MIKIDTRFSLFALLAGTFVTALVVGDIIGGKLTEMHVGGRSIVVSVGMIPFPITFVLTDILNEFYGKRAARFVTLGGFFMALFAYATIFFAMSLPWAGFTRAPGWGGMTEPAFDNVFNGSKRILVGSMVAYLIAQFLDIAVFHGLKRLTSSKHLWLRATGSTVVSQMIDTVVITSFAWIGLLPLSEIVAIAVTSYIIKLIVAVGLTPLVYAGHAFVESTLGIPPMPVDDGDTVDTAE